MSTGSNFDLFAMCLFSSIAGLPVYGLLATRYDLDDGGLLWIVVAIVIFSILRFGEGYLSAK